MEKVAKRRLEVGAHVVCVTPERYAVNALVEVVHADFSRLGLKWEECTPENTRGRVAEAAEAHLRDHGQWPCVNLVFIQPDDTMKDQYGRQKGHLGSVGHWKTQGVPKGNFWMFPDEVPDHVTIGQKAYFDQPLDG